MFMTRNKCFLKLFLTYLLTIFLGDPFCNFFNSFELAIKFCFVDTPAEFFRNDVCPF
jgi:hypothetical protein